MPVKQIVHPIGGVAIPALSRVYKDPERYRRVFHQFQEKITFVAIPAIVFLVVTADITFPLLLGEQWIEAVPIFRWLGLAGIIQTATNSNGWVFVSQGRTREMFYWGLANSLVSIGSFLIGLRWGAIGVAASYAIANVVIRTPLLTWWIGRSGILSGADYWRPLKWPAVAGAATLLLSLTPIFALPGLPALYRLLVAVGLIAAVGGFFLLGTKSGRSFVGTALSALSAE